MKVTEAMADLSLKFDSLEAEWKEEVASQPREEAEEDAVEEWKEEVEDRQQRQGWRRNSMTYGHERRIKRRR